MLLEFLLSMISEGIENALVSPRIPVVIRLLSLTILSSLVIGICVLCTFTSYKATGILGAVIASTFAIIFLFLWLLGCWKIIKSKQKSD